MIESHWLLHDYWAASSLRVPASQENITGDQKRLMVLVKLQKNERREYCINWCLRIESGRSNFVIGESRINRSQLAMLHFRDFQVHLFHVTEKCAKYPRPRLSFESFSTIHAYSSKTHIWGCVLVPGLTSNFSGAHISCFRKFPFLPAFI